MALKGNLRDFTITQLLNLVNLARKTGTLMIEGQGNSARITFRDGKLAFATIGQEDNSLAAILQQNKKISTGQYKALKTRTVSMTDKELGLLLINAGYLSQEDILTSLQQYFVGVVRRLFTWVDGFFRFEPELGAPDDKIAVRVDLENLIVEGARQLRELETLQDEIPSLDVALKFTDRPGTNLRQVNLSVDEWKVVSYVNPKNSIRQIARATHLNDLDIRRVVYSLMQAGLVELVRMSSGSLPAPRVLTAVEKDNKTSLVNRLISRIRSL